MGGKKKKKDENDTEVMDRNWQWVRNSERQERRKINLVTLKQRGGEREETAALQANSSVGVTACLSWRAWSSEKQRRYLGKHWSLLSSDWSARLYAAKLKGSVPHIRNMPKDGALLSDSQTSQDSWQTVKRVQVCSIFTISFWMDHGDHHKTSRCHYYLEVKTGK